MKTVLVLGGTMFVGRALVEKLISISEYEITLFNRGKSNAHLFPLVNQIHGNRETDDILQISNQYWDYVIDFSGYYPVSFERLLNSLKGKVNRYIFISTISVYDLEKFTGRIITESDEVLACDDVQRTSKLPNAYGQKKAEMERILLEQDWLDKIILRPSFIYGKYDWTERFYYWLYRAKNFEKILVPKDFNICLTYADDLVDGILNAVAAKEHKSVYNTISQPEISLRGVVEVAGKCLNKKPDFIAASDSLLEKNGIDPSVFPLFVPFDFTVDGKYWLKDFSVVPTDFAASMDATLQYYENLGWPLPRAGLSVEKEKEILRGI